jgi:hypothetical protein
VTMTARMGQGLVCADVRVAQRNARPSEAEIHRESGRMAEVS